MASLASAYTVGKVLAPSPTRLRHRAASRWRCPVQAAHDRFVKHPLGDPRHMAELLRATLPATIVGALDLGALRRVDTQLVDSRLRPRLADLLFEVPLHGRPALLYLVFEHRSTVDRLLAARMFVYGARVIDDWLAHADHSAEVPVVLLVVLYHGTRRWDAATDVYELLDLSPALRQRLGAVLPRWGLQLVDLSQIPDAALCAGVWVTLVLRLLKHIRDPDIVAQLARWADLVRTVVRSDTGLRRLEALITYLLETGGVGRQTALADTLAAILGDQGADMVHTAADALREGGRREGKRIEARRLLTRLLEARFGPLPPDARRRIRRASLTRLERWALRVPDAACLDDVFAAQ